MNISKICSIALILVFLCGFGYPRIAYATDESVTLYCNVDRLSVNKGDTLHVFLTVNNSTQFRLENVSIKFEGGNFAVSNAGSLPSIIQQFSSARSDWDLTSNAVGQQNIIFSVTYTWQDDVSKSIHQEIRTVTVNDISVNPPITLNWPDYLIPLLIGVFVSQCVTWINDSSKERRERKQQEEQAYGVLIALLHSAKKAIDVNEIIPFTLWDDMILKNNLFPALHRLSKKIKKPELSKQLAELPISISDYNERHEKSTLTDSVKYNLLTEISAILGILESKSDII